MIDNFVNTIQLGIFNIISCSPQKLSHVSSTRRMTEMYVTSQKRAGEKEYVLPVGTGLIEEDWQIAEYRGRLGVGEGLGLLFQ